MKKGIVTTFSGHHLDVLDPDPNKIEIVDIAHGLSLCCRYAGQCKFFYSVAQHCVNGSYHANPSDKLAFLMHDSPEAYMGDLVKNIKELLPKYKTIQDNLEAVIFKKFNIIDYDPVGVKRIDNAIMAAEAEVLMKNTVDWYFPEDPLKADIILENTNTVKNRFLFLFNYYNKHAREMY